MPTYEYRCTTCDHEFECFQLITEEPLDACPQCGGHPRRIISGGAGLLFKGNGFYITDYRSDGYKLDAKKDRPASESKKSTDAASESKKSSDAASESKKSTDAAPAPKKKSDS